MVITNKEQTKQTWNLLKGGGLFGWTTVQGCPFFNASLAKRSRHVKFTANDPYRKTHKHRKPKQKQKAKFTGVWGSTSPSEASRRPIVTSSPLPVSTYRSREIMENIRRFYLLIHLCNDSNDTGINQSFSQNPVIVPCICIVVVVIFCLFVCFWWFKLSVKTVCKAAWDFFSVCPHGHPAEFTNFWNFYNSVETFQFQQELNKQGLTFSVVNFVAPLLPSVDITCSSTSMNLASPPGSVAQTSYL